MEQSGSWLLASPSPHSDVFGRGSTNSHSSHLKRDGSKQLQLWGDAQQGLLCIFQVFPFSQLATMPLMCCNRVKCRTSPGLESTASFFTPCIYIAVSLCINLGRVKLLYVNVTLKHLGTADVSALPFLKLASPTYWRKPSKTFLIKNQTSNARPGS